MGVLRQSCGADLTGGLASVNVSGCLTGFGTSISPISITIDPTGLLTCGVGGLRLLNAPTGVGGLSFVTVTGCLTGSGTPTSPLSITLNPTGGLNCTISGLALQQSYLTQVITSGCFDGIGTVGSPLLIKVDPTGLITCGAAGIKLLNAPVASITTTGCLTGSGTIASPLSITLNPTGSIHCTPGGLALQIDPTGLLGYGSNGIKLLNSPVASVTSTGCLSGSGIVGSPLTLNLNPTGGIHCTSSGLALQQTYLTQVITSGCFDGIGTVGSPLLLRINPTGLIQCTPNGIAFNGATGILNGVSVLGCISGNGLTVPLQIKIDPTGLLACGNDGLRYIGPTGGVGGLPAAPINSVQFNQSGLFGGSSNFTWDGNNQILNVTGTVTAKNVTNYVHTITDGPSVDINPNNGAIQLWTLGGVRTPTASSFLEGQSVLLMIDDGAGNTINWSTVNPTWVDGEPTLLTTGYNFIEFWKAGSTIYGAALASGVTGTTSPALPFNSLQFNNSGIFGGSPKLTWDGTTLGLSGSLNVSGAILTSDAAHVLAQRNSTNPQGFRLYNTYTNGSNYERATIDWTGSPGVLQIGTSHAGTGTAKGVQILTSGTPRIDISSNGQVQFNQAYTFPTGLGASGQTFVNNGAGSLSWSTTYVYATGCVEGSGTIASPLQVKVDPTGLLACGTNGLRYIGPTGGGGGTPASPNMSIQFNNGGSFGGSSGFRWDPTFSGVIVSSSSATGTLLSVGRTVDTTPLFDLKQYFDFISARYATIRGEGLYLAQDSTDNRVGLMGQFGFRLASNLSYGFSDSSSGISNLDVTLYRDAADTFAQRRLTNAQKFSIYKTYTSLSNYERGTLDWQGSPGTFRIGTEQAGTGTSNPVHLITSGTPRIEIAANGQVQFNQAYTFPTGLGASGQTLVNNGAGFLDWGTSYVYSTGCITGSGSLVSPLQVKLDPTGLLACGSAGLRYIGPTGGVAGLPAAPNTSIQFNDGGLFGGSSRLTYDGTIVGLSGAINVSGATLTGDSAHILAQRNGASAQGSRIYNTYTNGSNYERGIIDWAGSPGVLQIGTQHAGTGTAKPVQIVTSGTPRIEIAALGNIQFNQAYTFPTGVGSSGQTFVNNGTSTLIWGLPSVRATGCLTGSGTLATPLQLLINPTGFLHCTPLGLAYNGPTGVGGGGGGLTYVTATGCISGSGTTESPISIALNPTGGISCGANGLYLSNSGLTYIVTSTCLAGSGTTASPARISLNPTGLINCTANGLAFGGPTGIMFNGVQTMGCISGNGLTDPLNVKLNPTGLINCTANGLAFSGPTGILFNGVQTFGCISGNGTTNSIGLKVDPTGLLTCGANGIRLSNAVGAGSNSLHLNVTGGATHANPTTAVDLVFNNGSSGVTIDFRPLIYFNMGQAGTLAADGSIDNQPRFIVPEGFQMEICRAYLTIGQPGSDTTTVQLQRYVATEDCTEPGTNGTPFSKDITTGCTWQRWNEVEGLTLGSLTHLTFRVLTPGTDAENLVAHFWARVTVCFEP